MRDRRTRHHEEEAVIAGAGPIGLACAISARRAGLNPLVIDAGAIVNSILHYPIRMSFFTTPELLEIGGHPFPCSGQKPTREEALKYYRGVANAEGVRVRTFTRLVGAKRQDGALRLFLTGTDGRAELTTRRLVLATGYYDHPNLLGIPGEDLPHVSHYYDEGHAYYQRDVVVVGGRNSAVEAALDLFRSGARVTLVYRGSSFPPSVKYWVRPDVENRIQADEIAARLGAHLQSIERRHVVIQTADGAREEIPADRVYALTGYHPDHDLFRRIGIQLSGETLRPEHDSDSLETNVPGVHLAGSITAGRKTSEIFIENGRFDGDKIFRSMEPAP